MSYITGSHNAKVGYDGGYFSRQETNMVNDMRMTYNYAWPAADCAAGATVRQHQPAVPETIRSHGPGRDGRRPVPTTVEYNTGFGTLDDT